MDEVNPESFVVSVSARSGPSYEVKVVPCYQEQLHACSLTAQISRESATRNPHVSIGIAAHTDFPFKSVVAKVVMQARVSDHWSPAVMLRLRAGLISFAFVQESLGALGHVIDSLFLCCRHRDMGSGRMPRQACRDYLATIHKCALIAGRNSN